MKMMNEIEYDNKPQNPKTPWDEKTMSLERQAQSDMKYYYSFLSKLFGRRGPNWARAQIGSAPALLIIGLPTL